MTINVTDLDHIVLRVGDIERSLNFYEKLLGLEVEGRKEFSTGERPFVSVRIGAQLVDLWPDADYDPDLGAKHSGLLHFCARVSGDLAGDIIPQLDKAGVQVLDRPAVRFGATGYGESVYVRDPDGYVLELKQST